MTDKDLDQYIEKNYRKFLDYANFHASRNGLTNLGSELLNFVLEIVLGDMDRGKVLDLLGRKYGNYNELHTYILGMIKINAFSPRSDFHRKVLNRLPIDDNVNVSHLLLTDETEMQRDISGDVVREMNVLRLLSSRVLNDEELRLFNQKYIKMDHLSNLEGKQEVMYKIMNGADEKLKAMVKFCQFLVKDKAAVMEL
ncbi:hypothetical protein [Prolixibacter denitrificans]|uniref:Uncharacterized protein n=1 Tax=Prolixibacter denitrificans TaxID=1541063 RepID=A0A2P8CJY3_9BACT|nr:hypothetical protein [Prolixibacter denitrificans]PSK85255.1 hypothetical protein CLV93_101207 [Prolixibacter denitrificans]GET19877.1 hypothetical protein JCM18694_01230 [Prolixibacter denitrificans]